MRYALCTLLVEDGEGRGQPVAFAILAREDQEHIETFLTLFMNENDMSQTVVTVVDKDMAEINAIKKCWPTTHLVICYFHVLRAIDRYLATSALSQSDKESCCEVGRKVVSLGYFFVLIVYHI